MLRAATLGEQQQVGVFAPGMEPAQEIAGLALGRVVDASGGVSLGAAGVGLENAGHHGSCVVVSPTGR